VYARRGFFTQFTLDDLLKVYLKLTLDVFSKTAKVCVKSVQLMN